MVLQFTEPLCILKVTSQASVGKVVVVLIELQTRQVFFPPWFAIPCLIGFRECCSEQFIFKSLTFREFYNRYLRNYFYKLLIRVNKKWSSYNMFLMLSKTQQVILNVIFSSELSVFLFQGDLFWNLLELVLFVSLSFFHISPSH